MEKKSRSTPRRGGWALLMLMATACVVGLTLFAAGVSAGNGHGNQSPGEPQGNGYGHQPASQAPAASHQTQGTAGTSGSPQQPQPKSNADQTGSGANHPGPYDSTRNGAPSQNGNGQGKAVGKPCAGCVGKADNKNPKGQYPNGSDHNKGYECDGNNGIGKTNPAHTGCSSPPSCSSSCPPPPACQSSCAPPPSGCRSSCAPPPSGCQSGCSVPQGCQSNCAPPSVTPPQTPITVTCPKGGGMITITGANGTTTIRCSSGQRTVTPKTPGVVTVVTSHHQVVQRVGVAKPSGSQLTG